MFIRSVSIVFTLALFSSGAGLVAADQDLQVRFNQLDFKKELGGYDGGFVLYDMQTHQWSRYNNTACAKRRSPCSTFKIFNSLVGLETGVLADENTVYKWDGKPKYLKSWNKDHNLTSAFAYSVVWYYQRLAREIGQDRMDAWFGRVPYGNGDWSGGIDRFWLDGALRISADEQVAFLARLYRSELPFGERAQKKVRNMMVAVKSGKGEISGKTGTAARDGKRVLGWYVGRVSHQGRDHIFALVLDKGDQPSGPVAKKKVMKILKKLNLHPK